VQQNEGAFQGYHFLVKNIGNGVSLCQTAVKNAYDKIF
jgi:hypothetical protein